MTMQTSLCGTHYTPGRWQLKTPILSLETEFLIAICRHTGDKWQSKTLFLSIFDPHSSIVDSIFNCCLPGVHYMGMYMNGTNGKYRT